MDKYNGKKKASEWVGKTVAVVRDFKLPTFSGYETPKVVKKGAVYLVEGINPRGGLDLKLVDGYKPFDYLSSLRGVDYKLVFDRDVYRAMDSINSSARKIDSIINDAKDNDPDFYRELASIFKNATHEAKGHD